MTFDNKLRKLRKDKNMSQEDLALTLGVSRQAVSKWENGQGYPETDKIIAIGRLFGVTTDYLLVDGENGEKVDDLEEGYYVSRETAAAYLANKKRDVFIISIGVAILILSLVPIFTYIETSVISLVAFILIALIGVSVLVYQGFVSRDYSNIEKQPLVFDAKFLKEATAECSEEIKKLGLMIVLGIAVIVLGVLFLIVVTYNLSDDALPPILGFFPVIIAVGVFILINAGSSIEARNILIHNDRHITEIKKSSGYEMLFPLAAMIYLFIGFVFNAWHPGWIIFPITAILFAFLTERD